MKKTHLIATSLSLGLLIALSGCNGTQADAQVTISGKAIDPYLKDATVYMDTNANGQYDPGEPNATTDAYGDYNLSVAKTYANKNYTVYAYGGVDTGTGTDFNGTLAAVQETNVTNITPLTTLVQARYAADKNATLATIKNDTAVYLDLNVSDLDADIVKLADEQNETKPLKVALALEKIAEAHAADKNESQSEFYKERAENFDGNRTLIDDENLTGQEVQVVTDILALDDQNSSALAKAAGHAAANAGVAAGQDAANAGVTAGQNASHQGAQAGSDAANAGADNGQSAADTGAQAGNDAGNAGAAGAQAGSDAANAGAQTGNDAANQGATAGNNAAHQGAQAGSDAADAGAQAGSDAANAGADNGQSAADTAAQAGSDAANTGVETGNNSAKEGATLGAQTTGF